MDTTDTTKIDVHIGVNHPTVQIYDINKGTYTPDWSENVLELKPIVYADGLNVTGFLSDFKWVQIQGTETDEHLLISKATSTSEILQISDNLSQTIGAVRYKFYAWYNNKEFSNEISFALTVTGRDGTDGYTPQKGVDYFDGADGKDGTSVTIEGAAYAKTTPVTGSTIALYSDVGTTQPITGTETGESYLVDGYLCVYNADGNNFICTGKIQGPKGEQGDSSFLFVRYAEDQNGTNMSTSPNAQTTYIGFYRSSVDVAPTNPSLITWVKFVGTPASLVTITPSALYFKSTEGKNGTFTPDYIYLYPRFQTVTYSKWEYSVDGGVNWSAVTNASGSGLAVGTYNSVPNTLRISRSSPIYTETITSVSFRCLSSNSAIYDTVSVVKIYDVVDLKIGGRNLARYTDSENWSSYVSSTVSFSDGTRSKRIKAVCNATDESTTARFGIQQTTPSRLMKLKSGQQYTLSFLVRGNVANLKYIYLMNTGSTNQHIGSVDVTNLSETDFMKVSTTFTTRDVVDTSTGSYIMISYEGPKNPSLWFEIEEVQLELGQVATDWSIAPEDLIESAANVNVMLSNESHFFEADSNGVPTATSIVLDVVGYKGSIQSTTKIGTISGLPSTGMTATITDNETVNTKITIAITSTLTSEIADYGTLTIPITVNGHTINKKFSWVKAKAGATGAGASLVTINPSALYFKSTNGKDGVFTPNYVFLYPKFQNVSYRSWQYSVDGGTTWIDTTGVNGLEVVTRNGIGNVLRISNTSTIYTDEITSISFRCNSSDTTVYDVVSIAKIYDIVDLQIGGRNLLTNSGYMKTLDGWKNYTASTPIENLALEDNDVYGSVLTATGTAESSRIKVGKYIPYLQKANRTLTFSMIYSASVDPTTVTVGGKYSESDASGEYGQFYGGVVKRVDLGNGFTYMECPVNLTYTEATRSFFVYIYPRVQTLKIVWCKLEEGNQATDWSPAPEDLVEEASNTTVMLSNEAHLFEADANGVPTATNITLDVVGFKGATQVSTTVGSIAGIPNGMTATIQNNNTVNTKIVIAVTTSLTSVDYGTLTIPITVNGKVINKIFSWSKAKEGAVGAKGDTGAGIRSTTVTYGVSTSASTRPADTAWQSTIPAVTDGQYLWTRTIIDYTDDAIPDTVTYTYAKQGIQGSSGSSVTVSSIQYQAGTSATTAPTGTWSNAVVAVAEGSYLWTKTTFSDGKIAYGVAKQGVSGSNASLVDITPSALYFKSSKGKDGVFEPEYIYLYPRFQNATYNGWQYSLDGGATWVNASTLNGLSIAAHGGIGNSLRISRSSSLYTDTVTSISFRCNTLDSNIYDVVSISKIYDVADLQIGGRNYILNSADLSVSGLGSTAGSRMEYKYIDVGQSYMGIEDGTEATISFDLEMTVGTENPTLMVYNTNRRGPKTFAAKTLRFTAAVGDTIKQRCSTVVTIIDAEDPTQTSNFIEFYSTYETSNWFKISNLKLEIGNTATDWTPAPEDLIESAANTSVILSNEAHLFESDLNGAALPATIVLDIMGFKGATRSATKVGTITGIPSTGMAVSTSNNDTTNTKITITVNNRLTPAIADYGSLTIPITVNGHTINKVFSWAKSNDLSSVNIGGRNLLYDSTFNEGLVWPQVRGTIIAAEPDKPNSKIYHVLHTNTSTTTATSSPINNDRRMYLNLKKGESLAISYDFYAEDLEKVGTPVASLRVADTETTSTMTSLYNHSKAQLIDAGVVNGKWQRVSFIYTATDDISGWFVFGLYARAEIGATIDYKYREIKIERGNKVTAWTPAIEDMVGVTFQLYAPKGYLLTNEVPELTLETFAYNGSQAITDATFKWYSWSGETWVVISGATSASLIVGKTDVMKSNVYKCEMTYRGKVYEATATVEDKTDIYESLIRVIAKQSPTNRMYWILYTTVYSEDGEHDPLLGPISETAPTSPTTGAYWYKVDATNYTVTLMKYSGTAWATTTDTQELLYDWFLFKDATDMVSLGTQGKVKIITANDFSRVCSVQCNIFDADYTLFSRNSQVLNDPSDPIVSATEPPNPIDKQLWIKIADNGTYIISIWDEATKEWLVSEADSQNKVHVSKPTLYTAGDIWIVGGDYQPIIYTNGVAQTTRYLTGTMLKAQSVSATYSDADWVEALNYKESIDDLKDQLNIYNQYFSFDDTGLTMTARSLSGQISEFKTKLTNTELGFYQGENKVAYINNNQLNISKAEISNGLAITGTSPILSVGGFSFVVESNGSLSIITNT